MLLTFVSCNKEVEQTTETTKTPINPEDVIIDPKYWYRTEDEYQMFLEHNDLPEDYIPYTQLPYSEGIWSVAMDEDSEGWICLYQYDTGLIFKIYLGKRDFDLSNAYGKLLLEPDLSDIAFVSTYFRGNTNGIYVEKDIVYCFNNGDLTKMFWKSASHDYSFMVSRGEGLTSGSIPEPIPADHPFDHDYYSNVLDPFLLRVTETEENPIEFFDDILFGTPQS